MVNLDLDHDLGPGPRVEPPLASNGEVRGSVEGLEGSHKTLDPEPNPKINEVPVLLMALRAERVPEVIRPPIREAQAQSLGAECAQNGHAPPPRDPHEYQDHAHWFG